MDPRDRKIALRAINYGLFVLSSVDGDKLGAASVNWLSQASFDPPLIMVAVKADSDTHGLIDRSGVLAVSVLGEDQLEIGKAFFRTTEVEGDRINGQRFEPAPKTGCPIFVDLPYWFESRVTDTIKRGDHTVFIAEVVGAGARDAEATPLLLRATGMNYGG